MSPSSPRCGVNLMGENTNIVMNNIGALLDASKEIGLEVITKNTKYKFVSRYQTIGKNHCT